MGQRSIVKDGAEFFVVTGEDVGHDAFWDWYASPHWEPDTVAVFAACVAPGTRVADIGAWIGPTTLLAAGKGAEVVAVEPDPVAAAMLERNLALNPELASRVTLLHVAIADTDGTVALLSASGGGDSLSHLRFGRDEDGASWNVRSYAMSTFLGLPEVGEPTFLKFDAEGAEYAAIPTMEGYIAKRRPSIYVATHPNLLYDRRTPGTRIRSGLAALSANRRMLKALASYRHHYAYGDGGFTDIRRRNLARTRLPIPARSSLLIGSCLFTDRPLAP
jgi:FkbM family methyltransferase